MAVVKPFICIRPAKEHAAEVAALPYDVYNRKEACAAVKGNPLSFLNIDRAETQFSDDVDTYADCVYEKARELLDSQIADGIYVTDAGITTIFTSRRWTDAARQGSSPAVPLMIM